MPAKPHDAIVLAPSLGRRFSGINATMEALLPVMARSISIACCGTHLSERMPRTTLWKWLRSPNRKQWRIWHARRNNDMIVGLLLRYVLRQKLILLFTSAAQRDHSWLTKFCYRRMDRLIATTELAAGFLKRSATVSHHGVDNATFHPAADRAAVRRSLGLASRPTLGVFGRVRPQKGTGDLVEALIAVLPEFPQWQVIFVGAVSKQHANYQADLQRQLDAAGLADRVKFQGFLRDFSQLPAWYQAVNVVGCVSRNEGFGITCLEGMASGAPVLATRAGAWADIVRDGQNGWLANPGDPEDLAGALRKALSTDREQLRCMGDNALETVRDRFTIAHESRRIEAIYRDLLQEYADRVSNENSRAQNSGLPAEML